MTKNNSLFAIFAIFISVASSSKALTTEETKMAEAAGAYYGAIVFAKEFKKTRCGNINIDKKWTDTERARQEIRAKFSKKARLELDRDWNKWHAQTHVKIAEFIQYLESPKYQNADCAKIQVVFWNVFKTALDEWKTL